MKIFQGTELDIHHFVLEEPFHAWQEVLLGILAAKNLGELVDRSRERFLDPQVIDLGQLMIEGLETRPVLSSKDKSEGWEVE
jgi:hypothetical protein